MSLTETLECWRWDGENLTLRVRLQPRGGRDEIVGTENRMLKIRVKTPPADGAANQSLIKLISHKLGVPRSQIALRSGHHHRNKTLQVSGLATIDTALIQLGLKRA